jgi:hypothetical protein
VVSCRRARVAELADAADSSAGRVGLKFLEVAVGLEPTKVGFADRRLDHFGIAASEKSRDSHAAGMA